MVQLNQNVVKGQGRVSFTSLNAGLNNVVIPTPYPVGFTFDPQIEVRELRTQGPLAVSELTRLVEQSATPLLTITLPPTLQAMAMLFNGQWADAAGTSVQILKQFPVTSGTVAAAATGTEGFGIAEDAEAIGSYIAGGDSSAVVQLTRAAYSGYDSTVDDTFAVGENGELLLADNLVSQTDVTASFRIPNVLSVRELDPDLIFDTFKVNINLIMVGLDIVTMEFPSMQVRPDARTFDPAAEGFELQFAKLYNGEGCGVNPTIYSLGNAQKVAC